MLPWGSFEKNCWETCLKSTERPWCMKCSLLNVFETYKTYAAHCVVHEIVHLLLFQALQVRKLCLHHVGTAFSQDNNQTNHSRNKTWLLFDLFHSEELRLTLYILFWDGTQKVCSARQVRVKWRTTGLWRPTSPSSPADHPPQLATSKVYSKSNTNTNKYKQIQTNTNK